VSQPVGGNFENGPGEPCTLWPRVAFAIAAQSHSSEETPAWLPSSIAG
jgi:hypothetical protein